jgi:nucleotide-binding universal stress UspA family protein
VRGGVRASEPRGRPDPYFSAHPIGEESDALALSNAHARVVQRVAVIAQLRDGAETEARNLIEAGPPFDLGDAGFEQHSVFVGNGVVVFFFEGDDVERQLTELVNDPIRAAGFGAWTPVLAESPRVAHETYYWSREEKTMKKIVIATDGSPSALEAVEYGLELAADQGAEPIFVHVAPATEVLPVVGYGMGAPVSVPHEPDEHDRTSLDEAMEIAAQKGLEAKAELVMGNAAHAIVAYADSVDADLIVVGSRGHGTIAGALLGSVSRSVLHEAKRPVLVVRTAADRAEIVA